VDSQVVVGRLPVVVVVVVVIVVVVVVVAAVVVHAASVIPVLRPWAAAIFANHSARWLDACDAPR
jgi:hypothetical protein